jgi:hypothetical protein
LRPDHEIVGPAVIERFAVAAQSGHFIIAGQIAITRLAIKLDPSIDLSRQ